MPHSSTLRVHPTEGRNSASDGQRNDTGQEHSGAPTIPCARISEAAEEADEQRQQTDGLEGNRYNCRNTRTTHHAFACPLLSPLEQEATA